MLRDKVRGYIYVISNRAYKGCVKVGKARNPKLRLKQLSGATGVLWPFRIEAYFRSDDYTGDEARAHDRLRPHRVRTSKEFYRLSAQDTIAQLSTLLGPPRYLRPDHKAYLEQHQVQEAQAEVVRLQAIQRAKQQRAAELEAALEARHKRKIHVRLFLVSLVAALVLGGVVYGRLYG
jgi:hypothetical protein